MGGGREHGYARYRLDGCRCYVCGYACSRYRENRAKAIIAGSWQPWVDAEPVRVHVRTLQSCSMGLRAIAAAAGVDRKRLQAVLNGRPERGTGPQEKVRPELAAALLAVEPTLGYLGGAVPVDATGTHRRMQALVAMGWPMARLAARLEVTPGNFSMLMARDQVLVRTVRLARGVYDELWNQDPRAHGVDNQAYSRALHHAASRGWPPVGAWDDDTIDDPSAVAWMAPADEPRLSKNELGAVRREEVEHLMQAGTANAEIARRLGMGESGVRNIVADLRGESPAAAARTGGARQLKPCGTRAAYQRHLANGEEPCSACQGANNQADRRYRLTGSTNTA